MRSQVDDLVTAAHCKAYKSDDSCKKKNFQASQLLKKLYIRQMVRKYVGGITPQRKAQVLSAGTAIRSQYIHCTFERTVESQTNLLHIVIYFMLDTSSLFLAHVKSTSELHLSRQEGKLSL